MHIYLPRPHPLSTQVQPQQHTTGLMWFRRDLRIHDNAALFYALSHCQQVHAVFVFDQTILNALTNRADRRVEFILKSCQQLKHALQQAGGDLHVLFDYAETAIPKLAQSLHAQAVFTNHDYEPRAIERDQQVQHQLTTQHCAFYTFKDHVIFEKNEVLTQSKRPFSVYTPYKNAWLARLNRFHLSAYPSEQRLNALAPYSQALDFPSLEQLGFEPTNLNEFIKAGEQGAQHTFEQFLNRIHHYHNQRDFPAVKGVSYLSVHLRFGTLSIRQAAREAFNRVEALGCEGSKKWLEELIWRDFYAQILYHHPHAEHRAFKTEYDAIEWEQGPHAQSLFQAWCEGKTGYPLVDAAMRQLNTCGWQHNRLRMITASFLTKDLGLDWRWGEQYFAQQLNDFDLSSNNGGWQWAASTGCDAQPWFRIFNPTTQSEKFDPQGQFIRRYCPELSKLNNKQIHNPSQCSPLELTMAGIQLGLTYPNPIVQHDEARKITLERYGVVKKKEEGTMTGSGSS